MTELFLRDTIDCAVKLWTLRYFSSAMENRTGKRGQKAAATVLFICFVLFERYVLNSETLGEAYVRNIILYLLTCVVMLAWKEGQTQYLVFLASIVFFLWGGWLKLFSPVVFSSLGLPTFGYAVNELFPRLPVTIAENACRVLVVVFLRRYAFAISPDREISVREAFLALVPAIIDHTTVLTLYYLTIIAPSLQSAQISFEMTLLTLMLVFGMPCILAATEQLFQLRQEKLSLLHMEHQMKMQVQDFESRKLSDDQARRIYHDLAKHLAILKDMAANGGQEGAVVEYLNDILSRGEPEAPHIRTGNTVLDTLLTQKDRECRSKGICLECMVDLRQADHIRYDDIVAMFSNVLDNAITAVCGLPEPERSITLSAGVIGGQLIVKCLNPYRGELSQRADGLFATSKADAELHGIGLSNLKRIVEAYQGVLNIETADGIFTIEWMLPVPVAA